MENLMRLWGMEKLTEDFIENGIDLQVLQICSYNDLLPVLGTLNLGEKIKFKKYLEKLQTKSECLDIAKVQPANCTRPLISGDNDQKAVMLFKNDSKNDDAVISAQFTGAERQLQTDRFSEIFEEEIEVTMEPSTKRSKIDIFQSEFDQFRESITKSVDGKRILCFYEKKNYLDSAHRSQLSRLVVSQETAGTFKHITTERFLKMAQFIVKMFPTEIEQTWYTPYKLIDGKNKVNAKGKLLYCYHNTRKCLIKDGLITKTVHSLRSTYTRSSNTVTIVDADIADKLEWLKTNGEPFETASVYWRETTSTRLNDFNTTYDSVKHYFDTYPLLKKKTGAKLILIDFHELYPDQSLNLFNIWSYFKDKIVKHAVQRRERDSVFRMSLLDIVDLQVEDDDPSTVDDMSIICLLAFLLSNCKRIKCPKKTWRPTKQDAIEGILLTVQSSTSLESAIEQKKREFASYGLTLPPLTVVVVKEDEEKCSSYVVINENLYICDSPITALDLCLKAFKVLHLDFPHQSKIAWTFIQLYLYKLKTDDVESYVKASNLANNLELI